MHSIPARGLTRVVAPAFEPLTLAETKLYLRVDHSDDDASIGRMIQAAREAAEFYLRRSLVTQDWLLERDDGIAEAVALSRGPVQSVLSVQRISSSGTVTETLATALYRLNAARSHLLLDTVVNDRVRVTYRTGYGAAEDVPAALRQGLLAHVAALYEGVSTAGLTEHCINIYAPYRELSL